MIENLNSLSIIKIYRQRSLKLKLSNTTTRAKLDEKPPWIFLILEFFIYRRNNVPAIFYVSWRKTLVSILKKAINIMVKRPVMAICLAALSLIYSFFCLYSPVLPVLFHLNEIGRSEAGGGLVSVDSILLIIKLLLSVEVLKYGIAGAVIFSIVCSVLAGFILSGCLYMLRNALGQKPGFKGEYLEGLKAYFSKTVWITFRVVIFSCFFTVFYAVVSIPALVGARSLAMGRSEFSIPAMLVGVLTVFILAAALMFLRTYAAFWYTAAFYDHSKPFAAGKKAADVLFWRTAGGLLIFDFAYILFTAGSLYIRYFSRQGAGISGINSFLLLIISAAFMTVFIAALSVFIFSSYKKYIDTK